jgi:hypothetical protein
MVRLRQQGPERDWETARILRTSNLYREFESRSLRQLVPAFAVSPDKSLKSPEFPGFSAQVCRRRLSPRGRQAGNAAMVSVRRFCGSVSLLTG